MTSVVIFSLTGPLHHNPWVAGEHKSIADASAIGSPIGDSERPFSLISIPTYLIGCTQGLRFVFKG